MNDKRKELLAVIAELANRYPHWRVGQLVSNIAGWADVNVWDAEDEQLLEAARSHVEYRWGAEQAEKPIVSAAQDS